MILRIPKISLSTLFVLIPIYYFNSCTSEFVKHSSLFLPIVAAFSALWFFSILAEKRKISKSFFYCLLCTVTFIFLLFLFLILGLQDRILVLTSNFSNTLFLLFFICIFLVYSDENKRNDRILILAFWLVDTVISCFYSIYKLIENPFLSRYLSTGSFHQTKEAVFARGVISFGGVYGLVLVSLLLFYLVLNKTKKIIPCILLMSLFFLMIAISQFTIAIILVVVGIIIMITTNNVTAYNVKLRVLIIILVSIPLISLFPIMLQALIKHQVFGYEVTARLEEITFIFGGDLATTDLMSRFIQYGRSIGVFFTTFCLGKLWFPSAISGTHSELFDGLANYGLLFGIFIAALIFLFKFVLSTLKTKKAQHVYKLIFLMYILMSMLNTSTWAPITLNLFVIIPFICLNEEQPNQTIISETL